MIPADKSPDVAKNSDPTAAPLERNGQNGAGKKESDYWPFEGSRPPRLTPGEIESLLQLWDEEDERQAVIGLKEIFETGGHKFADFFPELKRAAGIDD